MSRPRGSGWYKLCTKSGSNKKKGTIWHYSSQSTTREGGSIVGWHIIKINTLTSQFAFSSDISKSQMLISAPFWVRLAKQIQPISQPYGQTPWSGWKVMPFMNSRRVSQNNIFRWTDENVVLGALTIYGSSGVAKLKILCIGLLLD